VNTRWAVAAVLTSLLLLAACSDDDGEGDDAAPVTAASSSTEQAACDWPTWGQSPARTFSYPCDSDISPETVGDLTQQWFFNTGDVVTATPAVVDGTLYVGDWAGTFYALDQETGEERWTYATEPHETVYAGQIVSSATVATVEGLDEDEPDGTPVVFFGGGKTMYALRADTGEEVWTHELGEPGNTTEPTEIESSPVVVDGRVIFGYDAHDRPGFAAGVVALDARTGDELWEFDPDQGAEPTGCVGVWSSPSVDVERGLVFAGTANCVTSPDGWGDFTEALFAVELATGEPVWSYQPHEPNNDDFDFAGSPNLFEADGRALVGLGNKDAAYYAVDRETGELVWSTQATEPGIEERGSNFSTGGFIGPTAYADGVIVGGTAVGPCPCLHALDAATGEILWQSDTPEPTYAAATEVGGVVFLGGTDFTLRAYDLDGGDILWSHEMDGVVAGGAAVVGNDVFAVAGIREPGTSPPSETSGVYRFSLDGDGPAPTTATTDTTRPANTAPVFLEPSDQPCIDAVCDLPFGLFPVPDGLNPRATLEIATTPFAIRIVAEGLGAPIDWVNPDSETFAEGATVFAAYLSTSDDNPTGTLVCVFDASGVCEGDTIPVVDPQYNRLTILAVPDETFPLSPATGVPRLVTTTNFDPVLVVIDPPEGD
jgi:polyvinyl alcohol dehydrogenase (cytochrome)